MRNFVITLMVMSLAYALYTVAHNLPAAMHFQLKLVFAVCVLLDAVLLGRYMFLFRTMCRASLAGLIVMLGISVPPLSAEAMARTMLVVNPWNAALAIVYLSNIPAVQLSLRHGAGKKKSGLEDAVARRPAAVHRGAHEGHG